jgi:hypothetical protein
MTRAAFPKPRLPLLLPLACALLLLPVGRGQIAASDIEPNCAIQEGSCTRQVDDRTVTLDILPKPVKAMRDLTFRVSVSGGPPPAAPYIDLGMPGMEMGPNQVRLEPVNATTFEGTGVIVR